MRLLILILLPALSLAGYDPLSVAGGWLLDGWKEILSPLQPREMCNFWPTCSRFTRQAVLEQGFLPGVVIGADRLLRCNQFAWTSYDEYYFGTSHDRMQDPVGNHIAWSAPVNEPVSATVIAPDTAPLLRLPPAGLPAASFDFGAWLYRDGDFLRAGDEYARVAFLDPDSATRELARLMAGESYLRAGALADSRRLFAAVPGDLGDWGTARAWFAAGEYDSTRRSLEAIDSCDLQYQTRVLTGWSLYRQHRFGEAALGFAEFYADTLLAPLATMDGRDMARRSRLLSTVLSVVIPGAGQLYSGRAGDAIYALLVVGGSGALTWWFASEHEQRDPTLVQTSLFGALTTLFHAGNIYGANIAARDYNRLQERRYLARVEELLERVRLEPDYSAPTDTAR